MFAMTHRRLLATVIVAFALAALLASAAFYSEASADHSWGSYHWPRAANPFEVQLGDNVSGDWDQYLSITAGAEPPNPDNYNDWNGPMVAYDGYRDMLDPEIVTGGTSDSKGPRTPRKCAATIGRVEVCNAEYGPNGWLGVAQLWASGSHITQATAKLNDSYFTRADYNNPEWKQSTMCHEVGHTFGLDHQSEDFDVDKHTCLDYYSRPDYDNMGPNQHDYDQLKAIYDNHTEASNTSSRTARRTPAALSEIDTSDPGQRGRLIRKEGREEVYQRAFAGGHKIFTFVILADEGSPAPTTAGGEGADQAAHRHR